MRTIPGAILERIRKLQQTHAGGADPRINLVMQRTKKYIEQGSMLEPFDLWEGSNLGPLSVAYRRENRMTGPDKIFLAYIEGGTAHMASTEYLKSIEEKGTWNYEYQIGPAADIAIEFNGHWERTHKDADICFDSPAAWTLVTEGDPYIFVVKSNGDLTVQIGQGQQTELATGVTKVAAIRAWKNVYRWNHDQGLICAYLKSGRVHYRNWCNQGTEENPLPPTWEPEREVTELPHPAQAIGLFRTNDYRVGFLCESNGAIHWAITDRNWAGMAIEDHTITARACDLLIDFIYRPITYEDAYSPDHTVTATAVIEEIVLLWGAAGNAFRSAANDGDTTVKAVCRHFLTALDPTDFRVYDSGGAWFAVNAASYGATDFDLELTTDSLNYAEEGDLTLRFMGTGSTRGEAGQAVDPFEIDFTPEGLEYAEITAPEVEAIWNE